MDLAIVGDFVNSALILAKEIGKGGGGSTEEPTVCFTLLPVGLGVAYVAWQSWRRRGASSRPSPATSRPAESPA